MLKIVCILCKVTNEPSDQSQTTDENSKIGPTEEQELLGQWNTDLLKSWVVNTISCVLKNFKLTSKGNSDSEMAKCIESSIQKVAEYSTIIYSIYVILLLDLKQ